jgi:hypothetical protein
MTIAEYKAHLLGELANVRHQPASLTTFVQAAQLIEVFAHATICSTKSNGSRFRELVRTVVGVAFQQSRRRTSGARAGCSRGHHDTTCPSIAIVG